MKPRPFSALRSLCSVFQFVIPQQHEGKILQIYEWKFIFKFSQSTDICFKYYNAQDNFH